MIDCTFQLSPQEVDRIVVQCLIRHLEWAKDTIARPCHPDDVIEATKDIEAMKRVIDFFGGNMP